MESLLGFLYNLPLATQFIKQVTWLFHVSMSLYVNSSMSALSQFPGDCFPQKRLNFNASFCIVDTFFFYKECQIS